MNYIYLSILSLLLFIGALRCDSDDELDFLEQETQDVVGLYAQRTKVVLITKIPDMGMEFASTTTSYGFAKVTQIEDGSLTFKEWFCHVDYESNESPITVIIPDSVTTTIEGIAPLEVREEKGEVVFYRPMVPIGVGVDLTKIENDELPTDPTHPSIWDQDNDGKLGVTTLMPDMNGELYSVRRERYTFDLRWQDKTQGTLFGLFTDSSEESSLAASDPALESIHLEYAPDPDPTKSTIVMKRLDEEYSCDRLMAEKSNLYPAK